MAMKSDINLFKAAGGEKAKSRKVPLTKKAGYVAVLVTILVIGAVAGLLYYNTIVTAELDAVKKEGETYNLTSGDDIVLTLQQELKNLRNQAEVGTVIELSSQMKPGFFTDLSDTELTLIRNRLFPTVTTEDVIETDRTRMVEDFERVAEDVRRALIIRGSSINSADGVEVAGALKRIEYFYSALTFMRNTQVIMANLPMQDPDGAGDFWYCYYRGNMIMLLKTTENEALTLVDELTDSTLYESRPTPFTSLRGSTGSEGIDNYYMVQSVVINEGSEEVPENVEYCLISLTVKSIIERLFDTINAKINTLSAPQDYREYVVSELRFGVEKEDYVLTFNIEFEQTEECRIRDIFNAIIASPVFEDNSTAYPESSAVGKATAAISLRVVNQASAIVNAGAIGEYTGQEE